ncbi:unnamed protein product [Polarella glacialis]|uniref:tRNA (Uracil-5-)-methyltransferase n=1 Tax=Polarella glacialis TaxID=89957 RepID=A0A813FTF3_POLGL|nr:unnamed protein product [Polarella glacialis]
MAARDDDADFGSKQDALPKKPCRSGRTGMRPFGTLGPRVEVEKYREQLEEKAAAVRAALRGAVLEAVLEAMEVFPSPPTGHRHRAGPFAVRRPSSALRASQGLYLEMSMWDPVARGHSLVRASEVPIYSAPIAAAMEALRRLPIELDLELLDEDEPDEDHDWEKAGADQDSAPNAWGQVIGRGLRTIQFHSTLSGELMVCLTYSDERLRTLKRGEKLPGEDSSSWETSAQGVAWTSAAREVRQALSTAVAAVGFSQPEIDVVGRWRRRRLCVDRDYVVERIALADGRELEYRQPEGQFSNPNVPCEVHCLDWLCREAQLLQQEAACSLGSSSSSSVRLLELHCGGGNNTVALAPYFEEVYAVEINRSLADACEHNLAANHIRNVRLLRAPSAATDATAAAACHAVLVDPPRSGLDDETRTLVAGFDHLLYISCNPAALAEDLRFLGPDFEVLKLALFDMFPYTTHAECAVRVRRRVRRWSVIPVGRLLRQLASPWWMPLTVIATAAVAWWLRQRRCRGQFFIS